MTKAYLLQSERFKLAPPPPNFETLIRIFEIENQTLNLNFETPAWNFIKFFGSSLQLSFTNFVICFVNQIITQNLKSKQNFKIKVSTKI